MPTIPAVYLIGDGENQQPLEKFGEMELDESTVTPLTTISASSSTTTTSSGYSSCGGGDR